MSICCALDTHHALAPLLGIVSSPPPCFHRSLQAALLQDELSRLQAEMEAKQAAMHSMSQHSALRQAYDGRLHDLQEQRDELQRERAELMQKLESLQAASGGWAAWGVGGRRGVWEAAWLRPGCSSIEPVAAPVLIAMPLSNAAGSVRRDVHRTHLPPIPCPPRPPPPLPPVAPECRGGAAAAALAVRVAHQSLGPAGQGSAGQGVSRGGGGAWGSVQLGCGTTALPRSRPLLLPLLPACSPCVCCRRSGGCWSWSA